MKDDVQLEKLIEGPTNPHRMHVSSKNIIEFFMYGGAFIFLYILAILRLIFNWNVFYFFGLTILAFFFLFWTIRTLMKDNNKHINFDKDFLFPGLKASIYWVLICTVLVAHVEDFGVEQLAVIVISLLEGLTNAKEALKVYNELI